jgi:hypothetical protein
MEERLENESGTVGSNVRNIFEPPSRWYSKDEHAYAQRRAKLTSHRSPGCGELQALSPPRATLRRSPHMVQKPDRSKGECAASRDVSDSALVRSW